MKKHLLPIMLTLMLIIGAGCTANERAKSFGGTVKVNLPAGERLVTATWKEAELWYLTRPARDGEEATTYTFAEKSGFGLIEGKVLFIEH